MMKKRIIAVFLAAALLLSFSACGSGETDWAYIEKNGEIIIGITYFEPMNYLDTSGKLVGFETEFTEAVCEILGVKPKFQEINWGSKVEELNAKSIDVIWNGMTINETLKKETEISVPYMKNNQVLIAKKGNAKALSASADTKKIVAEIGSAGETTVKEEEFFKTSEYIGVDTQAKAVLEVASGTADGCVIDLIAAVGMIGEGTDYPDLVIVENRAFGDEEYGIAVRKGDTELIGKINDAIKQLKENGKLLELAKKYNLELLLITD